MLYNTLHNIKTIADKDPQKALAELIMLAKDSKVQLDLALTDGIRHNGKMINHEIRPLNEMKKHWEYELKSNKAHHYNGGISQDKIILRAINNYAKSHKNNEWANLNLDFNHDDYTLTPISKQVILDLIFTIQNKGHRR